VAAAAAVAVAVADRSSVCCEHYQSLHKQLWEPAVTAKTTVGARQKGKKKKKNPKKKKKTKKNK
jgi:hypothetical protein